jgi:hypothetical protein
MSAHSSIPQSMRRLPVRSSSETQTSPVSTASGWSTAVMGGTSPGGRGTRRAWAGAALAESVPRAGSGGGACERTSCAQLAGAALLTGHPGASASVY